MPKSTAKNPFDLVYSTLWDLVLQHPYFQTIQPGNRIRFDDRVNRNIIKPSLGAGDLPELMLMIDATTTNQRDTSCSSKCVRIYSWQLCSGDFRYTELMGELEWALFCAMVNWPEKLGALRWKELAFVKRVALLGASTGISNPDANRNIQGWAALWRVEVEMHFQTSHLLGEIRCNDNVT